MRYINVNGCDTEISSKNAEKLLQSGAIYECGPDHGYDLHLTPDHTFTLDEVELLMSSDLSE